MPKAGAFYVMDRGYIDFQRFVFTLSPAVFVVRTKSNLARQSGATAFMVQCHFDEGALGRPQ